MIFDNNILDLVITANLYPLKNTIVYTLKEKQFLPVNSSHIEVLSIIIITLCVRIERPWNEALSSKIAEVQDSFKNIPSMLYFSPSSVTFDGIGVYAAETLPKGMICTFSFF